MLCSSNLEKRSSVTQNVCTRTVLHQAGHGQQYQVELIGCHFRVPRWQVLPASSSHTIANTSELLPGWLLSGQVEQQLLLLPRADDAGSLLLAQSHCGVSRATPDCFLTIDFHMLSRQEGLISTPA